MDTDPTMRDRGFIRPFEHAPRPLVGYAHDYPAGHATGRHAHPRAQLLYATDGLMRVDTDVALFTVPPGAGLWMPAETPHAVRMDGVVRMRALFLRADAAAAGPQAVGVIAVSPMLRELILAACDAPIAWDRHGRTAHVAALAVDEIAHATKLALALPAARDKRLCRVTDALRADPADPRDLAAHAAAAGASERTLARLFRAETAMTFQHWRRQLRLTEAFARLSGGQTPARVAAAVGYGSFPAFGQAFRETFGVTPGRAAARLMAAPGRSPGIG